jgi:Spy/CpxP family protein refolding chaperone
MKALRGVCPFVLVLSALASIASAQQVPPPPPSAADTQRPPTLADLQNIMDGWVLVQAQAVLNLTDAQFPPFITRLKALQDGRRRNQRLHNQLVAEIARLTSPATVPAPDEAQLREKLKALDDLEAKASAEVRKALQDLDQVLTLRQQARLRVFFDQVERRMLEFLSKARGVGPGRAGVGRKNR